MSRSRERVAPARVRRRGGDSRRGERLVRWRGGDGDRGGWRVRLRGERGQAAVEFVALLPLFAIVAVAMLQALAAGAAAELADHAAQSAAVAIAQGRDGTAAARAALPGWARGRLDVSASRTRVRVTLTPPSLLPGLGARLRATATADAGPAS